MIITGRIIDTEGSPIPGALIHDTRNGITAANDGTFEFESDGPTIYAVMVGFEEQSRFIAPNMEFVLTESSNSLLNAVTVIGYRFKEDPITVMSIIVLLLGLLYYVV